MALEKGDLRHDAGGKADISDIVIEDEGKASPRPDVESVGFDEKATKRLVRKIDYVTIPFVALLYVVAPWNLLPIYYSGSLLTLLPLGTY